MAPIELDSTPSRIPLATVSAHALTTVYLTALVGRTIVQSYFALPPSQNTRHRQPARNRHVKTFVALAGASFSFATFHAYTFSSLSYRIWAAERGVEGSPQITRWLNDTPIYRDALEIVAEKACHFWWSQQLNLSAQSWGILVAIEGQRRNIPHRWAFLMLAQLVSLSFAQNLWYVAMLLTPVPLPDNVGDLTGTYVPATISKFSQLKKKIMLSKPAEWKPHPLLYIFPLLWSLCTTFLIPIASNTPSFMTITLLSKSLTFTPILLPYIVPVSWGKVHAHPHESFGLYTSLFKSISVASGLLHGKESLRALLYNTPDSYYHRHILLYPFKTEYCSLFKRSTTAVGRVFGAVGDHPAVAAVRWDVLISSLSLGVWSAVQGLQVHKILANNIPFYQHAEKVVGNIGEEIKSEVKDIGSSALRVIEETPKPRKRGRPRKADTASPEASSVSQRAMRVSTARSTDDIDAAYIPMQVVPGEGDEDAEEDWEIAALVWGMISTLGLGAGSAGVFGAESIVR